MGNHRLEKPGRRAAPPPGRRRAARTRPRYGRFAVLGASLSVTGVAMLGGIGVLPSVAQGGDDTVRDPGTSSGTSAGSVLAASEASPQPAPSEVAAAPPATSKKKTKKDAQPTGSAETDDLAVPADSGEGRRIVFDQSEQRVWLVDDGEEVERTYLVSGSVTDNLQPGSYDVYSRSEDAVGIDDSGTMKYFVRFTQGPSGAAIGFHDIPVDNGSLVQTEDQLGTPQSHGCVRQEREDAVALWEFAPLGTDVEVVA